MTIQTCYKCKISVGLVIFYLSIFMGVIGPCNLLNIMQGSQTLDGRALARYPSSLSFWGVIPVFDRQTLQLYTISAHFWTSTFSKMIGNFQILAKALFDGVHFLVILLPEVPRYLKVGLKNTAGRIDFSKCTVFVLTESKTYLVQT